MEMRTFYSKAGHLTFYPEPPRRVIEDGQSKVLDSDPIEFSPTGVDSWGQFTTSDPAKIAACEARSDVVGPDGYYNAITPDSVRAGLLKSVVDDLQRMIVAQNDLIAKLQAQGKIPVTPPVGKNAQG